MKITGTNPTPYKGMSKITGTYHKPMNIEENNKEQVYNEYSSGKSILDNDKLREEWNKEFGNPPLMIEELTEHMGRCALCGIKANAIADWWLSKFQDLHKQILEETEAKAILKIHTYLHELAMQTKSVTELDLIEKIQKEALNKLKD